MSQQFWTEFLDLYQQHSALWDTQSSDYKRKDIRSQAYELLLQKIRQIDPFATLETVKQKIDIFRTGFRREERKVKEDAHIPTLWYYEKMKFLRSSIEYMEQQKAQKYKYSNNEDSLDAHHVKKKRASRQLVEIAIDILRNDEDDCSTFCANLKMQMQDLGTEQKYICQKLISDAIFLARTSQLNLTSCISTQSNMTYQTGSPSTLSDISNTE